MLKAQRLVKTLGRTLKHLTKISKHVQNFYIYAGHIGNSSPSLLKKRAESMYLFIFILHSRESELYRYILDGTSALAWELPFLRCLGHLSST